MPPKAPSQSSAPNPKKRKDPSSHYNNDNKTNKKHKPNDSRAKQRDARQLATQTSSKAFSNGVLDVDKFVKAREYEIRALEQGMQRSRKALNRRAFQQVPKELRRRGAAHDVRKVPKRLRGRARKEMQEDNTPTVSARTRKLFGKQRLRAETVKRLRALGARRKDGKGQREGVRGLEDRSRKEAANAQETEERGAVKIRGSKIKTAALAKPPIPKAKFRKRQKNKSWLPTHLFHAKRAHMTPPSAPMWKFALPLSPTQKSYRPSHRASGERGAICWDTSYMATLGLEGEVRSLLGVLRAVGVYEEWLVGAKGKKWRAGTRVLETMVYEREAPHHLIAPVTVIWCAAVNVEMVDTAQQGSRKRKLFLRVHPSAFFDLWEEVVRLSKIAKPRVAVEDLRFELGSIEITGPGGTEALQSALWPNESARASDEHAAGSVEAAWASLAGLTNTGILPSGALLAFSVLDPKLHFPPRTIKLSKSQEEQSSLLQLLADWPVDTSQLTPAMFDRKARLLGSRLPSQKAVNRRKCLAMPGEYPAARPEDPRIPVMLHAPAASPQPDRQRHRSSSWHLIAPWKAIQPFWYSLMYCPLSTGQQPRFGGLDETRQLAFEAGTLWFPGDFPGTKAGWEWEVGQRRKRWEDWCKRPKAKRVSWEKVQVGEGKEGLGEVGEGWACDWKILLHAEDSAAAPKEAEKPAAERDAARGGDSTGEKQSDEKRAGEKQTLSIPPPPPKPENLTHMSSASAMALLMSPPALIPSDLAGRLMTIRLTLPTRGVPQTCARIYRLPSPTTNPKLRAAWLALHPSNRANDKQRKHALPRVTKSAPPHIVQQRLAASLLERPKAGGSDYPACPGQEDLIGFVTSGNFNLAEGKGTGVGCVMFDRVVEEARKGEEGRMCVVRNAGEDTGRLGRWDIV